MKGGEIRADNGVEAGLVSLLKDALGKGCFDAIMVPTRVPGGDSFTWFLTGEQELVNKSSPLPPVMPVQGAVALSSITRKGPFPLSIAAVLRPCEVRAAIELSKLKQIELANVTILSMDCPGAFQLSSYVSDPKKGDSDFESVLAGGDSELLRPICRSCTHFSQTAADLHVGSMGSKNGSLFLIPGSPKGEAMMEKLGIAADSEMVSWEKGVAEVKKKREDERSRAEASLKEKVEGTDKLLSTFSACIDCHNCMRVCPVCYCRQCFFDSEAVKLEPGNYLSRADRKGALRFPPDTLLFHLGRLSHMSLSCVSCGTCEDACPMSIPVAQVFSYVGSRTQKTFDYEPGRNREEQLPLLTFQMDELHDFEQPYVQTYAGKENANA